MGSEITGILRTVARAETNWTDPGAGRGYASERFRNRRAQDRDSGLLGELLDRYGSSPGRVLDIPAGTGRLRTLLSQHHTYVAVDRSLSMLEECDGARIVGAVHSLPFPDDSFDLVVCCRLLHHLPPSERRPAIAELVRVSRDLVLASFWDTCSWHALRRRTGLRRARHPDTRLAASRSALRMDLEVAGAQVLGHAASFRFISPQTFVAARVHGR